MKNIYLIGSLRNETVPLVGCKLREMGFEVFDDWYAAGPEADDRWRDYEIARGHNYKQALEGFAAKHVFDFDKHHLDLAELGILILPAGKSGHLELGYLIGKGVPCHVLFDSVPERYDVMYQFCIGRHFTFDSLKEALLLKSTSPEVTPIKTGLNDWRSHSPL